MQVLLTAAALLALGPHILYPTIFGCPCRSLISGWPEGWTGTPTGKRTYPEQQGEGHTSTSAYGVIPCVMRCTAMINSYYYRANAANVSRND